MLRGLVDEKESAGVRNEEGKTGNCRSQVCQERWIKCVKYYWEVNKIRTEKWPLDSQKSISCVLDKSTLCEVLERKQWKLISSWDNEKSAVGVNEHKKLPCEV